MATALAGVLAIGPAHTAFADPGHATVTITDADSLLGAIQGGKLLGLPPVAQLAGGAGSTLTSPEYWSNWVWQALDKNRFLLPIPFDPVKPDVLLPHRPIAAGPVASALPSRPVDLSHIRYSWHGHTKSVTDFLHDSNTDAMVFVHNGAVVGEYSANGFTPDVPHQAWSMTKTFVSTLVGIALDQHRISSLDDPIDRYIPELKGTAWQGTTIRNMLLMRSGIQWDESTEEFDKNNQTQEWINLFLDYYSNGRMGKTRNAYLSSLPRVSPQGVKFTYNSGNPQVLSWMLEKLYGKPFNEILSEQLWKPLGMQSSADIMTDRTGAAIASQGLFAVPRDYARLGELLRNGGVAANGKRIVSASYVREATSLIPASGPEGDDFGGYISRGDQVTSGAYGFQLWNGARPGEFQANGFQGQYITVDPKAGFTGVRLAHTVLMNSNGDYLGGGSSEWHTVYLAVLNAVQH